MLHVELCVGEKVSVRADSVPGEAGGKLGVRQNPEFGLGSPTGR